MSITRNDPNTVFLGGLRTQVNDFACSEAVTPGMLVERFNSAGVWRWRKHTVTTATAQLAAVATDMAMLNKGVGDASSTGDLIEVSEGAKGSTFWMLIASGQVIVHGDRMESAGDGTIRKFASGWPLFEALESKTNNGSGGAGALVRLRVETI